MSIKYGRVTGTAAPGSAAAATATAITFTDKDSPSKILKVMGTTANYTNAVNTMMFIMAGGTSVLWSGANVAKATAFTQACYVSGGYDGIVVFPGDTIAVVTAADIGAGPNSFAVSADIEK